MIFPNWPVSTRVHAVVTTRSGGVSIAPYHSLNMATHVGDDAFSVLRNRQIVHEQLVLPSEPVWLSQVHGCDIYDVDQTNDFSSIPVADASITHCHNIVLCVMTADCLPIFITDRCGTLVMAIHAGWRGLADGIIAAAVRRTEVSPADLLAWIGPGIGRQDFEVGDDVYQIFLSRNTAFPEHFTSLGQDNQGVDKYLADAVQIAKTQLSQLGVGWIGGGDWCTYQDAEQFFSYRREGRTGRMASLIWLSDTID